MNFIKLQIVKLRRIVSVRTKSNYKYIQRTKNIIKTFENTFI